jgi:hypothetical protein
MWGCELSFHEVVGIVRSRRRVPGVGDVQVRGKSERRSCFHVGAVPSPGADEVLEFVPDHGGRVALGVFAVVGDGGCAGPPAGFALGIALVELLVVVQRSMIVWRLVWFVRPVVQRRVSV